MKHTGLGWAAGLALAIGLAGCGGGGSSAPAASGSAPPSSPQTTQADAERFLEQSSFGATDASLAAVIAQGIPAYLDAQFATPTTGYPGFSYLDPDSSKGCPSGSANTCYRDNYTLFPLQAMFFRNAIGASDQLRQRVAFALSQIMVTSGLVVNQPYAMAAYQQILLNDAFANYRQLIDDVTLSPAMGAYLNMVNNNKGDAKKGTSPNENYAREINQLFSLGTVLLNADGSPQLDSSGAPMPTYSQDVVQNFAALFTGWTYPPQPGATSKWQNPEYGLGQMVAFADHHDTNAKTLLRGTVLPAGQDAATDLKAGLDNIFQHPNLGPFIGRQLIQFLVTSAPSPAYVARISAVFADDGKGVRGDLKAVVRAILLDPEARGDAKTDAGYGRLREPAQLLTAVIRGIGGGSSTDGVFLQYAASQQSQSVLQPASVFSFFSPAYVIPETTQVSPSFGIYNATTAFQRSANLGSLLGADIPPDSTVTNATGTHLDLSAWTAVAGDPAALVGKIDDRFFHHTMPFAMSSGIIQVLNGIDATQTDQRARVALYLALTSVQFQVEQ